MLDRDLRAAVNVLSHQIGQQAAQEARQALLARLEDMRTTGADRAALLAFLATCDSEGRVVDAT